MKGSIQKLCLFPKGEKGRGEGWGRGALHGSFLLVSTQECILVWQGKNGKNGTVTGFVNA